MGSRSTRTRKRLAVGALVLGALLAGLMPGTASANDGRALANSRTWLCLDSNAAQTAYTHWCNGGDYRTWIPRA
ncbi:hypothetical protein SUDANB171_04877 [Streptomyces sp. enrichment culture]|uniref:hypothetical protein n=1 Tax=Streptomyces sp. enrichment culture TaxID=1795815 RepID=UPI003F57C952